MAPFESVLANFVIFTVLSSGSSKGECKKPHNIRDAFCEAYNRTTNTIHANLFGFQERVVTSDFLAQACVALAETAVLY